MRHPTLRRALAPTFGAVLAALSSSPLWAQAPAQASLDPEALASRIVTQLALEPGERVLLLMQRGAFDSLVPHLRYAVMRAGGVDLGALEVLAEPVPATWDLDVIVRGRDAARNTYRGLLHDVDAAVMLPGASTAHPAYAALQDLLAEGGARRTVHFHWLQGGSAFPLPGQPLPPPHVIEATYQRAVLETDYRALRAAMDRFEALAREAEVRVTTPAGTDLRFRVGTRHFNMQDGDASAARARRGVVLIDREIELPAGAVRVAPLEESVSGIVAFPPSQWSGRPVEGLRLHFERGRISGVEATSGGEAAAAELDEGAPAARSFREFALGFNPLLAVPDRGPWIPYYGYGAGVVRLSLGDNSELGGTVRGDYVRWNFFADATVTVGETVVVTDGRLVLE
jgi:hypothetical protein